MGEGVDTELEGFEAGREVFDAVELVSPRALGAFDAAVELRPLRRQDEEAQVALSACVLELGPELRPAIDLDALDAEGDLGDKLVEEGVDLDEFARPDRLHALVVLATVGVEDGWWESIVIGVSADAFSLKWR